MTDDVRGWKIKVGASVAGLIAADLAWVLTDSTVPLGLACLFAGMELIALFGLRNAEKTERREVKQ